MTTSRAEEALLRLKEIPAFFLTHFNLKISIDDLTLIADSDGFLSTLNANRGQVTAKLLEVKNAIETIKSGAASAAEVIAIAKDGTFISLCHKKNIAILDGLLQLQSALQKVYEPEGRAVSAAEVIKVASNGSLFSAYKKDDSSFELISGEIRTTLQALYDPEGRVVSAADMI